MITRVDLQYFKCFDLLRLPISALTLLSGSNASGKSSVLQALVLLHQTMREHEWSTRLMLNGTSIRLGTVADVVDKVYGRRTFEIGIVDDEREYRWSFAGERSEMSMSVDRVAVDGATVDEPEELRFLLPRNVDEAGSVLADRLRGLSYITAERVGPREVYPFEDRQVAPVVGPLGEHTVSVLHWGREEHVLEELALPGVPTRLNQVGERMRLLFPGCALMVGEVPHANAVTLGLRTSDDTDFHRPVHVGFGLTQSLPIVVAALSATRGDILLLENPEVHLHPAGQALMGQFLADVARAGVQVIVETHSDHVLNGIRRSVKAKRLSADQVSLYFFRPRSAGAAQVINPVVDNSGNIDTWPDGFFDQFDKDMNYFAGWAAEMDVLFNDLSIHGQFVDVSTFRDAVHRIMTIREVARRFGRELHCHRKVAAAQVTRNDSMPRAIQWLPIDERRALMQWLTRQGPFWEDLRVHDPGDYLECKDTVVTDSAVGEAAYRCFHGLECRLVSASPSSWQFSPVTVSWIRNADVRSTVEVLNHCDADEVEAALLAAPVPLLSWQQLAAIAVSRCARLVFSPDAFESLRGQPFAPGAAHRVLILLDALHRLRECVDENGQRTAEGHRLYQDHFTGDKAWFSDSSTSEQQDFKVELTFRHPVTGEELLFPWHGKVKTPQLRIHFSWPVGPDEPLCVVYVGPKITKR